MKILYLGDIGPGQTCLMRLRALERLGHRVLAVNTVEPWREAERIASKGHERCARGMYAYIYRCAAVLAQIQPGI